MVYLIFAVILTCCLGGISFFAFLALGLDVLLAAAFIAIAVLTRDGADSCKGMVQTPLGNGPASQDQGFGHNGLGTDQGENVTYSVHLGLACKLNTACFAVAIVGALLFICTAVMQIMLVRHHRKEKRYGPSPSNNYTSGYGSKFGFGRKKAAPTTNKDQEAGAGGLGYNAPDTRVSHETGYTGSAAAPHTHGHSGYYTAPTGTATQNPYGYTNTATNY